MAHRDQAGAGAPVAWHSFGAGPWALAGFAAAGIAISAYLTTVHFAGIPLVCTTGGVVDCEAVTASAYSLVPGTSIPVTIPGIFWFLVSGALAVIALLRRRHGRPEPSWLRPAHSLWAAAGLMVVLYLVYAEVVRLHRLCEWCTAVHLLVFLSLMVTLARLQSGIRER